VSVPVTSAGSFEYSVRYYCDEEWKNAKQPGRLIIDPLLVIDDQTKETLTLDGICCLTIIPKWMPTISMWDSYFKAFSDSGYNMVHFAPINKRGISNSPYSIKNQLSLCDDLFDESLSESQKVNIMKENIQNIRSKHKILCVTDIVWNHTSCDSEWLYRHPEAGYNLKTAPYLRPAYVLDQALFEFSIALEQTNGTIANMETEIELDRLLNLFREEYFEKVKLYEFNVLNIPVELERFNDMLTKTNRFANSSSDYKMKTYEVLVQQPRETLILALKGKLLVREHDYGRFSRIVKIEEAVSFMNVYCRHHMISELSDMLKAYEIILNDLNLIFYQEYDLDKIEIFQQIRNRAKFLRLDNHGPKLGPIGKK
jgi:glycogen debranching enzyme